MPTEDTEGNFNTFHFSLFFAFDWTLMVSDNMTSLNVYAEKLRILFFLGGGATLQVTQTITTINRDAGALFFVD